MPWPTPQFRLRCSRITIVLSLPHLPARFHLLNHHNHYWPRKRCFQDFWPRPWLQEFLPCYTHAIWMDLGKTFIHSLWSHPNQNSTSVYVLLHQANVWKLLKGQSTVVVDTKRDLSTHLCNICGKESPPDNPPGSQHQIIIIREKDHKCLEATTKLKKIPLPWKIRYTNVP